MFLLSRSGRGAGSNSYPRSNLLLGILSALRPLEGSTRAVNMLLRQSAKENHRSADKNVESN